MKWLSMTYKIDNQSVHTISRPCFSELEEIIIDKFNLLDLTEISLGITDEVFNKLSKLIYKYVRIYNKSLAERLDELIDWCLAIMKNYKHEDGYWVVSIVEIDFEEEARKAKEKEQETNE